MLAPLFGAVRSDIDRQIGWVKGEVRRQTRHTALIAALAGVGALAALGAIVVGLIALYSWLAMQTNPFAALGMIGGGLLVVALILFTLAYVVQRPPPVSRPQLQIAQPTALLGTLRQGSYGNVVASNAQMLNMATDAVRNGSRSTLLSALVLVAVMGLIAGRKLKRSTAPP